MKDTKMSYKLGYVANRTGVPSLAHQEQRLIEYGVVETSLYENLDDCLASLREGDTLVVYTTAILGRNKINKTFVALADIEAKGCHSLKSGNTYDVQGEGIRTLASAWDELDGVSKAQMGAVGKQLGGRKQGPPWKAQEEIKNCRNQGISIKELAEIYDTSQATIVRILK